MQTTAKIQPFSSQNRRGSCHTGGQSPDGSVSIDAGSTYSNKLQESLMPVPRKILNAKHQIRLKGDQDKQDGNGYIGTIQRKIIHKKQSAGVKVRKVLESDNDEAASRDYSHNVNHLHMMSHSLAVQQMTE